MNAILNVEMGKILSQKRTVVVKVNKAAPYLNIVNYK